MFGLLGNAWTRRFGVLTKKQTSHGRGAGGEHCKIPSIGGSAPEEGVLVFVMGWGLSFVLWMRGVFLIGLFGAVCFLVFEAS